MTCWKLWAHRIPFSPLEDTKLPEGTAGIYIGGGFPELYAEELAANYSIRQIIGKAIDRAMPVYAECGGLMYLGKSIRDFRGNEHSMVGSLPVSSRIDNHRLSLGYRTVKSAEDGPLINERPACSRDMNFTGPYWTMIQPRQMPMLLSTRASRLTLRTGECTTACRTKKKTKQNEKSSVR